MVSWPFLATQKNRPSPGQEAPAKVVIDRDQKDFHGILPGTIAD